MHCTIQYIENGISASVVVWFLVYLVEKQAVKAKKSSKVLTWAKKALLMFFLLVAYSYIRNVFRAQGQGTVLFAP